MRYLLIAMPRRLLVRAAGALLVLAGAVGCAELMQLKIPTIPLPPAPDPAPPSSPAPPASGTFGGCQLDATCGEGRGWAAEARAVVNTRIVGSPEAPGCTGVVLNNVRGDRTPYVLVARHCRNGSIPNVGEELDWWQFYFRRTSDRCGAPVSDRAGPCTLENRCIRGATVVATGSAEGAYSRSRDFMLVRLSRPIPSSFGVTYAGWSAEASPPRSAVVLGHPRGLPLAIAVSDNPVEASTTCDRSGTMWRVQVDRGQLVTGQSGSPVFDERRAVRGVVITGAGCNHPSYTCATSLAHNWTFGPPGERLIDHLAGGDARVRSLGAR